ncbi:hypothetical protein EOM09_02240 [bacterium]|nr:hypothetical protein [bacterium]
MNNINLELKEFILNSNLNNNQKNLWNNLIDSIKEEKEIATILETIKEDPGTLIFLTNNLEEKTEAIKNNDSKSWNNTVEKEKNFIIEKDN